MSARRTKAKKLIGLIVNPVAGMGGRVGLKGTDGEIYEEALRRGAQPVTPGRTRDFLAALTGREDLVFLVGPGDMGECFVEGLDASVCGSRRERTSGQDTRNLAREMMNDGADLIAFVGGDGTARDIYDAVGARLPVVGVPSGVKVYSSAFSVSATAAARTVEAFIRGVETVEREVLDIDEEAFREGSLDARLYGYLSVPDAEQFLQAGKEASGAGSSVRDAQRAIADYVVEEMDPEVLYLLGPGTTVRAVTEQLGVPKTLLGVDAVLAGSRIGADLNEQQILELCAKYERRKIIVTPLGGNGFVLGRGNRQFSPRVLRTVGKDNLLVVATRPKVGKLDCLRVDTDDRDLDEELAGYIDVVVGYRHYSVMRVRC